MKIIIGVLAIIVAGITLALCRASKEADEVLEHPERINIKGE